MKLSQAVGAYVVYKQSLGMRFATEARTLKSFYRSLDDADMNQVEPNLVEAFLTGKSPITRFWYRKIDALRGFYRFASRGATLPVRLCHIGTRATPNLRALHLLARRYQTATHGDSRS